MIATFQTHAECIKELEERILRKGIYPNNMFKHELQNGKCVKCEWLLYSSSQGHLYCFVCHLLSKIESPFASSGFNDWKHSNVIVEHKNGEERHKCMIAYLIWHKETRSVDSFLLEHHHSEQEY